MSFRASFFTFPAFVQFTNIKKIFSKHYDSSKTKCIYEKNQFTSLVFKLNNSIYVMKERK